MKILIVSQYYPPENTLMAPSLAHSLVGKGHQVRVLTGYPNYPTGRLFDGYKQQWRSREFDEQVEVLRVPLYSNHSQNAVLRTVNYLSFAATSTSARRFAGDADVVYVYATQMTAAFGPWIWRLCGGPPYVLHVQDLWPDSVTGSTMVRRRWVSRFVDSTLNWWLKSVYAQASWVVAIAPKMLATLRKRGVSEGTSSMVFNWAKESSALLEGEPKEAAVSRSLGTTLLYAGNIGDMQDLDTVVRAAGRVADLGVKLLIVGDGVALPHLRLLVEEANLKNVEFRHRVSRTEMSKIYSEVDFSVVSLRDLPNFHGTIPSKFQAALSHGCPVISTVQGDLRKIIEDSGIGFTADSENVESLASAFRSAAILSREQISRMGDMSLRLYREEFSMQSGVDQIERLLCEAADAS